MADDNELAVYPLSLLERLKRHENAFQSLLELIPSKLYYAQDAQTQWKKRKQTADEKKEAKRAKLDPDQTNSAADGRPVLNEGEDQPEEEGLSRSQIKRKRKAAAKEKKLAEEAAKEAEKQEEKKAEEKPAQANGDLPDDASDEEISPEKPTKPTPSKQVNGLKPKKEQKPSSQDTPTQSEPSAPQEPPKPTTNGTSTAIKKPVMTNGIKTSPSPGQPISRSPSIPVISSPAPEFPSPTSISELRARLNERISQARIARKAIGTAVPGAPKTREAILQARAKRKALVQEKIRQKKEEQLRNEGSAPLAVVKQEESSSEDEIEGSGLTFNRVISGGEEIDAGRGEIKTKKKVKGPSDPKTRLAQLDAKAERLAKMDPEKAERAKENDRWHHALLAARGEKVKDNPALLKKTISRREREKKKSKREWDERIAKVERDREDRQRKREENLAKRREEKGRKGKKVKVKKPVVKKKRPGFEGGRVKFGRK